MKTNLNGLCPACRRPYSDKDIEYKVITSEETAAHKARQAQKQKKTQAALQKEKQKAEADHLSRKHLAGLRVVQKNLVYVTGLSPTSQEDQLLATLRGDQYFGQYGKIIKIVVSKAKDPSHPHSVGVYVTYEHKEDAASCIAAVNGSKNGDRTLRAQFGTTKYCSAYLRNETCQNRSCMFLHEPGEANESYSRADLSALNAGSSAHGDGRPPPQSQQPVASAAQPMVRQSSGDLPVSPTTDRPALPSTASWASKPAQAQFGRIESRSTSGATEPPAVPDATPAPAPSVPEPPALPPQEQQQPVQPTAPAAPVSSKTIRSLKPKQASPLVSLLKNFSVDDFRFVFSTSSLSQADLEIVKNYPPLFDQSGGTKRRLRRQREEEQRRMEQEAQAFQQPPTVEPDDNLEMSGSLQLGGEPEERQNVGQSTSAIRPPGQDGGLDQRFRFGGPTSPSLGDQGLTQRQHQQLLLQTMKSSDSQGSLHSGLNQPTSFQPNSARQANNPPGHQRNVSRFSFANDTASASTTVQPVANPKLMTQQSAMMPQVGGFGSQQHGSQQFFTSNVQGPPPGLKTTGTPPVSGGMTFGQGHGFATGGLQYSANAGGRNANEEMMRNLLRVREAAGGVEAAKQQRELFTSPSNPYSSAYATAAAGQQQFAPPNNYAGSVFSSDSEKQGGGGQQRGKKKSKKHSRQHGNTSSMSSAFDLAGAEPHLLQNRFQAAQTAAGGMGTTGHYGSGSLMHGGGGYGGRW